MNKEPRYHVFGQCEHEAIEKVNELINDNNLRM
jgi:hypothetical protein